MVWIKSKGSKLSIKIIKGKCISSKDCNPLPNCTECPHKNSKPLSHQIFVPQEKFISFTCTVPWFGTPFRLYIVRGGTCFVHWQILFWFYIWMRSVAASSCPIVETASGCFRKEPQRLSRAERFLTTGNLIRSSHPSSNRL
jgi:hypothetical protein